jgi:hypothetical protein
MINKNLQKLAEQLGRDTLVDIVITPAAPVIGTRAIGEPFILKYDEFGKELVAKVNERFNGTSAAISTHRGVAFEDSKEIEHFCDLHRFAMVTAIYQDEHLKSLGKWPVTPLEAEEFIRDRKMPNEGKFRETLSFVLEPANSRDSEKNKNLSEAEAMRKELEKYLNELGSADNFQKPLLIVNPGLEKDGIFHYDVRPIVLPGLTKVYMPEAFNMEEDSYTFEYGLDKGVPRKEDLGKGNRIFHVQRGKGLYVFWRYHDLCLYNHNFEFSSQRYNSKMTFVERGVKNE